MVGSGRRRVVRWCDRSRINTRVTVSTCALWPISARVLRRPGMTQASPLARFVRSGLPTTPTAISESRKGISGQLEGAAAWLGCDINEMLMRAVVGLSPARACPGNQ